MAASAGCGNPLALAQLYPGEVVLDLGSGGGIDVLLAARRVGPGGFVWGLDMTDEMLALAEQNRRRSGLDHVAFLKGRIEAVPLPDSSVDVVISNCVINLSVDKAAVLREAARVLRPGGRLAAYDIVSRKPLPGAVRRMPRAWSRCVAGALGIATYERLLREAGLTDIEIQPVSTLESTCYGDTRQRLPIDSAFIRARKPGQVALGPAELSIEPASGADLPAILHLLEKAGLPADGVAEHLNGFFVARRRQQPGASLATAIPAATTVIGCAGIEPYGSQALLRSVAVTPPLQNMGVGRRLVEAALGRAIQNGATEVYLLTTTAEGYFTRLGFEHVERQAVCGPVTSSAEFTSACPQSAAVMRRQLTAGD